ncbi:MAG TPA: hypothetical protein PKL00_10090 [Bacillota bacterium]|nr:hypothetical protein [Bacillota bacterium]
MTATRKGERWRKGEVRTLKRLAGVIPLPGIASRLKRSQSAIILKAQKLGLSLSVFGGKPWSQEEVDFLVKNAGKMPLSQLAESLGRTKEAVRTRAKKLGIKTGYFKRRWTEEELTALSRLRKTHTAREIAKKMNRMPQSAAAKMLRSGMRSLNPNTTTFLGRKAEDYALTLLPGAVLLTRDDYHKRYDIDWNGKRVDVKSATLRYNEQARCSYWSFTTKGSQRNCDLYLCLGYLPGKDVPVKAWLIPSQMCPGRGFAISQNGKNHQFVNYEIEVKNNEDCAVR